MLPSSDRGSTKQHLSNYTRKKNRGVKHVKQSYFDKILPKLVKQRFTLT